MLYTIDLVNSWAEKLTYRIMVMAGVSEENLQKYLKAVVDKQNGVVAADKTLDTPITILGITFKNIGTVVKTGLVVIVLFIGYRLYMTYKRR